MACSTIGLRFIDDHHVERVINDPRAAGRAWRVLALVDARLPASSGECDHPSDALDGPCLSIRSSQRLLSASIFFP